MLFTRHSNPVEEDQDNNLQKGHGFLVRSSQGFYNGFLESTDRDLDFAINGEGFCCGDGRRNKVYKSR